MSPPPMCSRGGAGPETDPDQGRGGRCPGLCQDLESLRQGAAGLDGEESQPWWGPRPSPRVPSPTSSPAWIEVPRGPHFPSPHWLTPATSPELEFIKSVLKIAEAGKASIHQQVPRPGPAFQNPTHTPQLHSSRVPHSVPLATPSAEPYAPAVHLYTLPGARP